MNINHLGYQDKIQAVCSDSIKWIKANKRKFDYIFLDPPFDQIEYKSLLKTIYQSNTLKGDGKIFLESSKYTDLEFNNDQNILKDKIIGDVRLVILQ